MPVERTDAGPSFARTAAQKLGDLIRRAIRANGTCVIGLSGGSTPGPVYEELAGEMIDWSRVTVFLADDRCVSPDHPDSNQHLVRSALLSRLSEPPATLFHDTSLPPAEAAEAYGKRLEELLAERGADIVVLGMGPDGHIASLFPPLDERAFGPAFAIHTTTDAFAVHDRISVTLPVLAGAAHAVFLLKGEDKLRLWEEMEASTEDAHRWPARAVLEKGTVTLIAG